MRLSLKAAEAKNLADQLSEAAKTAKWDTIPKDLLTPLNLSLQGSDGYPPLYYIMLTGTARLLPTTAITEKGIVQKGKDGLTPLHAAAAGRKWTLLPKAWLTPKNLALQDNKGESPIHIIAANGELPLIASDIRNNPKVMLLTSLAGNTPLLLAAAHKQLALLGSDILTLRNLQKPNKQGRNCYHALAVNGGLNLLNSKLLLIDALSVPDKAGIRPVDLAERYHHLASLPISIKEQAVALIKGRSLSVVI